MPTDTPIASSCASFSLTDFRVVGVGDDDDGTDKNRRALLIEGSRLDSNLLMER
jgi:hypothetical protein